MQKNIFQVCEVELIYKSKVKPSERPKISCAADTMEVIKSSLDLDDMQHIERFYLMLLNRANKVLGIVKISDGGISSCIVDVKLIFQAALKGNASNIIIFHNHPSGNLRPSQADTNITKKIKDAGKLLDVELIDSMIIDCEGNYFSFANDGIL